MDMKLIGQEIAALRLRRGWTQRQLARQLAVSHQAVSKWEKGAAAPDLDTLMSMARLFGVSVDQLLRPDLAHGRMNTTTAFAADEEETAREAPRRPFDFDFGSDEEEEEDDDDYDEEDEDDEEDFDEDDDEEDEDGEEGKPLDPRLKMLMQVAPFVSREVLDEKFLEFLENNDLEDFNIAAQIAPFVSREVLGKAIDRVLDKKVDPEIVLRVAPFVSRADLMRLIQNMDDQSWVSKNFPRIAPFLPREYMDELVRNMKF
ncbi:MAG: helix-turn-helix transcriptional regulator [Anaerolineaceae bacterium]|nr:helix-turn-helix transcriptional regulator [Anaerolineaceae bacterium]